MPVGVYTGAQISIGNGVTVLFPYGWKVLDAAHVEVKVDGVVQVGNYAVTGVGNSNGGNVVFTVAPAIGAVVQRARKVPYKRDTDYQANGDFKEDTVDSDFDLEEMQLQQIAADVMRAFKAPLSVTGDQVLTDAMWAARAGLMLGFDGAGGLGVFAALNPANPASAYILTLLDDPDAATAAATLAVIAKAIGTAKGDLIGFTGNATPVRKGVGSDGQALAADSGQATGLVYIDNPSRPNMLVNPNWQIDQINEGALATVNASDVRGPDGWSGTAVGAGVFKLRTVVDPDHPSLKALEITCTTIDAAIAAADDYFIYTAIEGFDAAAFLYGEAGAKAGTIQFPFKSNVAGVYGVSVMNSAGNRRYVGSITVPDAAEHDYSLSFTTDTAGAWLFTNGVGMYLRICLAAGANFQTGAPGAWAAGAEQTIATQVNFMSNIANVAYLKRAQFIPGALVQAYRPADIQKELAKAQRCYAKTFPQGIAPVQSAGGSGALFVSLGGIAGPAIDWRFPVTMRAAPTVVTYNTSALNAAWRNATAGTDIAVSVSPDAGASVNNVHIAAGANGAGNDHCYIHASATARLS